MSKILEEGTTSPKWRNLLRLLFSNIIILIGISLPLIIHYLVNYFHVLQITFNLSAFYTLRDIYLIFLSIYWGYLFIEAVQVLRLPVIMWVLEEQESQVILKLFPRKDLFNKILGITPLDKLSNKITFTTEYSGKWGNRPEPLTPSLNNKNEIVQLPDTSKIPDNKFSYLKEGESDYIVVFWKQNNKYYKVDEFKYHPAMRFNDELRVDMPDTLEVKLDNNLDTYRIKLANLSKTKNEK